MPRYRANFLSGVASGVQNSTGQTVITGTNWPTNIPAGSYLPVTLNPGYFGANNISGPEVIYVTSVLGNVATVNRQQENSSLASGTVVPWVAGPLVADFDVFNLTSTGTLTLTGTNSLVVSGTTNFTGTVSGTTFNASTLINVPTGSLQVGQNATITGTLTATTITGTSLNIAGTSILQRTIISGYLSSYNGSSLVNPTMYNPTVFNGLDTDSLTASDLIVTSGLTVSNNASVGGNLTVGSYTTSNILPYTAPGGAPANNALLQYSTFYNNWVPVNSLTIGSNSATFPLTTVSNFLTGSNLGPAANTISNVTSVSLTAGVWMITACCLIENTASTIGYATSFLGPNSNSIIGAYASSSKTIGNATGAEYYVTMNINALVTLASTTTVYLNIDLANGSGPYVIYVNSLVGSIPNATGITAVKIG